MFTNLFKKKGYVPDPPSVALAVQFSKLPAPPYQTEESAAPVEKPELLPVDPVLVKVGATYNFITTGVIAEVRVEKIWQDNGETYVVISQRMRDGRTTHAIHISEFKQRVIAGGVKQLVI